MRVAQFRCRQVGDQVKFAHYGRAFKKGFLSVSLAGLYLCRLPRLFESKLMGYRTNVCCNLSVSFFVLGLRRENMQGLCPSASAPSSNITQIVNGALKTVGLTPSQTRGSRPGRPSGSYNWRKVQSFRPFFSDSCFSEGLTKKSKRLQKLNTGNIRERVVKVLGQYLFLWISQFVTIRVTRRKRGASLKR